MIAYLCNYNLLEGFTTNGTLIPQRKSLCGSGMIDGIMGEFNSVKVSTCELEKPRFEECVCDSLY